MPTLVADVVVAVDNVWVHVMAVWARAILAWGIKRNSCVVDKNNCLQVNCGHVHGAKRNEQNNRYLVKA